MIYYKGKRGDVIYDSLKFNLKCFLLDIHFYNKVVCKQIIEFPTVV
jgi:hypothetical protein